MNDLYNSKMNFYVDDVPYMRAFLAADDLSEFQKKVVREKIIIPGQKERFISVAEGVKKIRMGMNTFYAEETAIFNMIEDSFFEHEKCGLFNVEFLKVPHPHLSIRKQSPYKEILRVT